MKRLPAIPPDVYRSKKILHNMNGTAFGILEKKFLGFSFSLFSIFSFIFTRISGTKLLFEAADQYSNLAQSVFICYLYVVQDKI